MIKREFYSRRLDGVDLYIIYSTSGKYIERDGVMYSEAIDPDGFDRTYTETDVDIEQDDIPAEDALSIITGARNGYRGVEG